MLGYCKRYARPVYFSPAPLIDTALRRSPYSPSGSKEILEEGITF